MQSCEVVETFLFFQLFLQISIVFVRQELVELLLV